MSIHRECSPMCGKQRQQAANAVHYCKGFPNRFDIFKLVVMLKFPVTALTPDIFSAFTFEASVSVNVTAGASDPVPFTRIRLFEKYRSVKSLFCVEVVFVTVGL